MLGGDPTSGEKSIIASLKGKQARGTKGSKNENALPVKVDQELLGARRGERSYTAFARYLRLRRTTYVNIEKTGRTTLGKALDIADRLKVSPDHLLK
jgi:hypothetical protein